jgi:hypothetical protein
MSDIDIIRMGPGEFGVEVHEGTLDTSHRVVLPAALLDEVGFVDVADVSDDEQERVVRESFEFLLEREPASSIQREFNLERVPDAYPEYFDEIRRRLAS